MQGTECPEVVKPLSSQGHHHHCTGVNPPLLTFVPNKGWIVSQSSMPVPWVLSAVQVLIGKAFNFCGNHRALPLRLTKRFRCKCPEDQNHSSRITMRRNVICYGSQDSLFRMFCSKASQKKSWSDQLNFKGNHLLCKRLLEVCFLFAECRCCEL